MLLLLVVGTPTALAPPSPLLFVLEARAWLELAPQRRNT
jgi:hypothetical protein